MASKKAQKGKGQEVSLSMEQFYNLFMLDIEPELTTDMIPLLDELYAGEPEEERKERALRYAVAFEEFAERFDAAMDIWKKEVTKLRDAALSIAHERTKKKDSKKLDDIERSIDTA